MKGAKSLIKESIATKMLLVVLAVYLVIALLVSASHIWMNYNYQKEMITQELQNIEKAFARAIAVNLWGLDEEALHATVEGMLLIPTLVGVNINTEKGDTVAIAGIVKNNGESGDVGIHVKLAGLTLSGIKIPVNERYKYELFSRQFPIEYEVKGESIPLGQATIYSNSTVIYQRMKLQGFMLAFDIALTLLTFTLALMWVFNRFLRGPLASLASSAEKVSMENLDFFKVQTGLPGRNELTSLEESLNTMIDNLNKSKVERERAEEKLRKEQYSLRKAQEIGKIGSWELDIKENRLVWSDENYNIFGIPVGTKLTYQTFLDCVHPEDRDYVDKKWKASFKKEPYDIEHRILVDGNVKWVREKAELLFDENDECIGAIGLTQDITVLKQAEKALRDSHERFLTVLDGIDASVYVADFNTYEILFMNKHMIDSFGRDMTGEVCWKALRGESMQCLHCNNDTLVGKNNIPTGVVVWHDKNPITGKNYINHDRAIRWTDGRLVKLQIATDITDLLKMERQLLQAQKMESVGRLAGGVAHDFNNMLGVILGHAELAIEELDSSQPIFNDLQQIRQAANRSADITRQLLAFARKQIVSPKVIGLNDTVEGILKMLLRLIGEDIDLAWLPGKGLWTIKIDPSQIDQILANLCVNARDAIAGVGKITVETGNCTFDEEYCSIHAGFVLGQYVKINVSDNGSGMDKETVSHIFEPFFTTKGINEGTGLGLATVYGIVKQNNGFINVYSEQGQGTTFSIYLPRHVGMTNQEQLDSVEPALCGNETILLVEDELMILQMTRAMLQRLGYTVLAAGTPSEAIHLAAEQSGKIHLLLTDVIMPEMNGRTLTDKIMVGRPGLLCLFMSGYTSNVISHHGVLDDGVNFIQKPFAKREIAAKIRQVLDSR